MRPDTSQTEIELTPSLLCPLPSGLGPELGRELGRKLGTLEQSKETSKLRMTRDDCHAIPRTCQKQGSHLSHVWCSF